jgi:translocation and assembly module TamB
MRIAWKVLRVAAKVTVALVVASVLLIGVTWTFVQTRRGGELVRRLALPRVNAALAGTLTLDKLAFGGDRLTLEDLAIYDPEGNFVGRVARIDVSFSPLALLRRHVDVRALEIRRPELALVQDARGLNLLRALGPRHPAPAPSKPASASAGEQDRRLAVDVHALAVTGGLIDYRSSSSSGGGGGGHVHVADLSVRGKASLAGARVAVDAKIRARGGRVEANGVYDTDARTGTATVLAAVRGLGLTLDGRVDGGALAAHARVEAVDLAATAHGLTHDFALERIPMSGNGHLEVDASGTLDAPALRASVRFPVLGYGDDRVTDLQATAHVPDVRAPQSLDLDARAASVTAGAQNLRGITVSAHTAGRAVSLRAVVAGPQPLRVDLAGKRLAADARALTIDALTVRYPEATWTLRRPAHVSYGDALVLSGFELGADRQRLAIDVRAAGKKRTAHVTVARLDLGRLPRALLPPDAGLGGIVDADVRLEDGARPRVVATASLKNGRARGHRDLSLELAARLERGRARGKLDARVPGLKAAARFDVPADWPPRRTGAPIDLDIEVTDADLSTIARTVADARGIEPAHLVGHARASVKLDGTIAKPRLQASLKGHGLTVDGRSIGELAVDASADGSDKLAAQITVKAPVKAHFEVTAPLSPAALLRRPPTAAALARTSFEARGTLERLPIEAVARLAGYPLRAGGTVSAELAMKGTAAEPQGTLALDVAGATMPHVPPTDARVEVDLAGDSVAARARITRKSRPLVAAEARVGAAPGDLLENDRLPTVPITVRAVFGPFALQRLGLPPVTDREPARALKGKLHADLTVDGTIGAPRAVFHSQVGDVQLDKVAVGFAEIEARYADHQAKLDASLTSRGGGTLRATAALRADLGYPAVTHADLGHAPLEARLEAQRFDLQGFSGLTPELRALGGLLSASVSVQGTAVAPRPTGRLEWTDGVVAVLGFGEYRQIHLSLHGDENGVVLDELTAASGPGRARATGNAKRVGRGRYEVTLDSKLDRLPLYTEGQPLAVVSLTSRLRGTATPPDAKLDLDINEARIELPEAKRKELQPLDEPHDVVLVERGAPLNRAQAAKLRALDKAAAAPAAPPPRAPRLRVHVNSPRHLWVTGKDAYLELGVSPDFRVSVGSRTQVFGQVTVHRGRIDLYGRRFDIKADSTLTFGGSPDHPDLDVRAEHTNTTEGVTVLLTAKGPIDKLAISITSPNRPDLSESQLFTMIISGRLQLGGGGPSGGPAPAQAASLLGGVLASKLQSSLAHRLPFDVLTIDVGAEGVRGTTLEAGRYLTDRLYVGYIGRVASDPTRYQNRNAVHLEFQISSRWEIEGEYGDLGTGTADLFWKKSY